jgi:hypothetical protein
MYSERCQAGYGEYLRLLRGMVVRAAHRHRVSAPVQ